MRWCRYNYLEKRAKQSHASTFPVIPFSTTKMIQISFKKITYISYLVTAYWVHRSNVAKKTTADVLPKQGSKGYRKIQEQKRHYCFPYKDILEYARGGKGSSDEM